MRNAEFIFRFPFSVLRFPQVAGPQFPAWRPDRRPYFPDPSVGTRKLSGN